MKTNYKLGKKVLTGISLMLISHLGWIVPLILLPLLHDSLKIQALIVFVCLVFGNITYNLGMFLVGAEFVARMKLNHINMRWLWVQARLFWWLVKRRFVR